MMNGASALVLKVIAGPLLVAGLVLAGSWVHGAVGDHDTRIDENEISIVELRESLKSIKETSARNHRQVVDLLKEIKSGLD